MEYGEGGLHPTSILRPSPGGPGGFRRFGVHKDTWKPDGIEIKIGRGPSGNRGHFPGRKSQRRSPAPA